jgi:glycerol kinase
MVESTALGAAKLAARGIDFALEAARDQDPEGKRAPVRVFTPSLSEAARVARMDGWRAAVAKA